MKWKRAKSITGLLFSRINTYKSKVWRETFKQALERGLTQDEAKRCADDALRYAQGATNDIAKRDPKGDDDVTNR